MAGDARRVVWGIGTSRTLRVHWMLAELGLDYETQPIASRTGETRSDAFTALNPRQKIPVLEDAGLVLTESAAMIDYLAERYGDGRGFVPAPGTDARALHRQWGYFVMTELDAHTLYVLRKHEDLGDLYGSAPNAVKHAREGFAKQLAVADGELAAGGPWLVGDAFTSADLLLATCSGWALFYGLALPDTISDHLRRASARPAYARAMEVNFPPEVRAALAATREAARERGDASA